MEKKGGEGKEIWWMQDSCDGIDRVEKERGGQDSRNCVRSRNQCRLTVIQEVHKT